jgi:hypothetical protein
MAPQAECRRAQRAPLGRWLVETGPAGNDYLALPGVLELTKKGESFCSDLLVGQNIFHGKEFSLRQEKRSRTPIRKAFME